MDWNLQQIKSFDNKYSFHPVLARIVYGDEGIVQPSSWMHIEDIVPSVMTIRDASLEELAKVLYSVVCEELNCDEDDGTIDMAELMDKEEYIDNLSDVGDVSIGINGCNTVLCIGMGGYAPIHRPVGIDFAGVTVLEAVPHISCL